MGSLLLSSLVFFSVIRFIIEFFRDPLSNKTGGEMIWGLKVTQWEYFVFSLLIVILLLWREKTYKPSEAKVYSPSPSLNLQLGTLVILLLVFVLLRNWFTTPEAVALNMALLPAIFLTGFELYKKFSTQRLRWAYAALLLLPFFLMSQTLPQTRVDTVQTKEYNRYRTIGGGFASGSYTSERTSYQGSGCDMITNTSYYHQKYTSGTIAYSQTRVTPDRREILTFGGGVTAGNFIEENLTDGSTLNKTLIDINGFISYDLKWIGIGAGFHAGNLFYNNGDSFKEYTNITPSFYNSPSFFSTPVFPSAYFRVGPERFFFADLHIADNFPSSSPGLAFMTGVGSGFGIRNGFKVRTGFSFLDESALYVSAYIPIADRLVIEPLYWWTGKGFQDYPVDYPESQFSLGMSYRFGHK
jgi:hypothetical protein